jgi:hypothetical protein
VSDDTLKRSVSDFINRILDKLRFKKYDFTELYQSLKAWSVPGETSFGGEITDYYDHFKQHKRDLFKQATHGMTAEDAIEALCRHNPAPNSPAWVPNQDNKDFKSSITEDRRTSLLTAWENYEQQFKKYLDLYIFDQNLQHSLYPRVRKSASLLKHTFSSSNVSALLAGVCAAVSLYERLQDNKSVDKKAATGNLLELHPVQLLGIFRLLGVDEPPPDEGLLEKGRSYLLGRRFNEVFLGASIQNHLVEILTGQGKSYVLCVLAITLALLDFDVDSVCYSHILKTRDEAAFARLFEELGVRQHICYATFSELARAVFQREGDVVAGSRWLLGVDNKRPRDPTLSSREKVLLVDEVDVFFNQDFYGNAYQPSFLWNTPEIENILRFVWDGRQRSLTEQAVLTTPGYQELAKRFPDLVPVFKTQIRRMLQASRDFSTAEYKYEVQDGRIGYAEHGSINTKISKGFRTTFAYFHEFDKKSINEDQWRQGIGINMVCGRFSYAELPRAYKRIMGVTGTLASLGEFEKKVMRDEYAITQSTLIPSFYGARFSDFFQGADIVQTKNEFYLKIEQEIVHCRDAKRAVLIFFESERDINAFLASSYGSRIKDEISVVTEQHASRIDHYVKQATRSEACTLFPRVYGRGLDFTCYDTAVKASNGVHVLQTFLSADPSEEVQIQGRTCRQGQKGTYKLIVWAQDLLTWSPDGIQKADQKADQKAPPLVTHDDIKNIIQQPAIDQYNFLKNKRIIWFRTLAEERKKIVEDAQQGHAFTKGYQRALKKPTPDQKQLFSSLMQFQSCSTQVAGGLSIVFCLDESGSMYYEWTNLIQAFRAFVTVRMGLNADDTISVVQFSSRAKVSLSYGSLADATRFNPAFGGGGTNYKPALFKTKRVFTQAPAEHTDKQKVLVFMSDGDNADGQVRSEVKSLLNACPNLKFFAVMFGTASAPQLQAMAAQIPGGQYAQTLDASALEAEFVQIAESVSSVSYLG